jgi:glycosyltransferase involved in cell wall biosynthesis
MRFTIVTPSFNQLDWLRLCVASVRDQVAQAPHECGVASAKNAEKDEAGDLKSGRIGTKLCIEHIVQDAGTKGIEEFARENGGTFWREGRLIVSGHDKEGGGLQGGDYSLTIYSEKDEGMYDAINKGLLRSTGEICAYLNCDEQYLPGTLRWVEEYFSVSPQTDVLFGAAIVTRADGSYVCDRRVMAPTRWHTMVAGNLSFFTSSTFFRRKSVVERGLFFDSQWQVCGDAVWALRLLEAGLLMESTHNPLSAFAETGANLSTAGNPRAAEEGLRLARLAPKVMSTLKPLVLLNYRLRRWLSGAYALKPHEYEIYTVQDAQQRRRYYVRKPTFRWQPGIQ